MVVASGAEDFSTIYVVAIDLATETLLWRHRIDENRGFSGGTSGQYALLLNENDEPVLVFSTRQNGTWGLVVGEP